ncbi:serine/threonine-protein kinase [Streptomyces sp. B22F1]|uniref:serine/threonine-protein kinase n=1 Tax=Streptomyces sp. B22F1 TaxID=3153566 RepID=UPI00325F0E81
MRDQLFDGRYRLVRQLGEGGMGQVWEARDETLDRPVAVKVVSLLSGGGSRGDEARARFLREARITARLQHPNIVTIHDLGESGDGDSRIPFLVMELVRGEGLDVTLRRGPVGLPDAARWGAQICDALAEAHGMGVMHRDIKPSNVLITPSGSAKVLDFGVARAADPYATSDRLTRTGYIVGTPSYMAPEQARGHAEPRSDLYTLGCLLFELITGRLPFESPDAVGYLSAHLTLEPPAPSTLAPAVPAGWDDLVLTLLRKEPDQRHGDAADVAEALRRLDGAADPAGRGDDRTRPRTRPGTTTPLPPVDPTREASAVAAPDAPPATPRPAFRKARVAIPALVLTAAVTAGAAILLTDDADRNGDDDRSASQESTPPPVGFKNIPDVCGALSKDALLGALVEQPRPGEFSDKADYRTCEWDTDELASVPVDGHVIVYAYRFGATGKARAHMEEEKGRESLGGEAYVSLGMPGEIGDEAVIRVDKESVDKTVGGDVFHSFNSTSAAFRDSNLFIKIIYMRSRGDDPEENDRKTTRTGAEEIIKFLAATVEDSA